MFFCDQDDTWMETKIERVLKAFDARPDASLVYSDAVLFDEHSDRRMLLSDRKSDFFREDRPTCDVLGSLFRTHNVKGCLMAFRSDLREAALPIPDGWGHDRWLTVLSYALSGVASVREPLILHRRHADVATRTFAELRPQAADGSASNRVRNLLRKPKKVAGKAVRGRGRRGSADDRFRALATRLWELHHDDTRSPAAQRRLREYADRAELLANAFETRRDVRSLGVLARIGKSTSLLFARFYHRHFAGFLSYLDDLTCS